MKPLPGPSLISAYLDGELTAKQIERVERRARTDPRFRKQVNRLRELLGLVAKLPLNALPEAVLSRTLEQVRAAAGAGVDVLAELSPADLEELLSAYASDDLPEGIAALVTSALAQREDLRQRVDVHRRLVAMLEAEPVRSAPPEVLARLRKRLLNSNRGKRKRPFEELLSAYLDDEVAPEKKWKVEKRVSQSSIARTALDSLSRVHDAVSALPRVTAPPDLMEKVLSQIAPRPLTLASTSTKQSGSASLNDDFDSARRYGTTTRVRGGLSVAMLAASVAIATFSVWLIGRATPEKTVEMAQSDAPARRPSKAVDRREVDLTPLPSPADALALDASEEETPGTSELRRILAHDEAILANEVDEKQVTIATGDVQGLLKELEKTLGNLALEEEGSKPQSYVLELSGLPNQVGEVLSRLESMGRRGALLDRVGIDKPTGEVLAQIRNDGARGDSRRQVKVVHARIKDPKNPQDPRKQDLASKPARNPAKGSVARPIRVLLVVEPSR